MASTVALSHFPVGCPSYAPFCCRADCISRIRSGVGAFWPIGFGVLRDFDEAVVLFFAVLRADFRACAPETIGTALASSTAPKKHSHCLFLIVTGYSSGAGTAPARYTVSN